jgi:hypothetical protein
MTNNGGLTSPEKLKEYVKRALPIAKKILIRETRYDYLNIYVYIDETKYEKIAEFYKNLCGGFSRIRKMRLYRQSRRRLSFEYFMYKLMHDGVKIATIPYFDKYSVPYEYLHINDSVIFYGTYPTSRMAICDNYGRIFYKIIIDYLAFLIPHDAYPKEYLDTIFSINALIKEIGGQKYLPYLITILNKIKEATEKHGIKSPGLEIFFEKINAETLGTSLDLLAGAL